MERGGCGPVGDRLRLRRYANGVPSPDIFTLAQEPAGSPEAGQILVRNHYLSLNPAQRLFLRDWTDVRAGEAGLAAHRLLPGDVMFAETVGRVVSSRDGRFRPGDAVFGTFGVQDYALAAADEATPIDASAGPLSLYLGVLGWQGITAYFGVREIGRAQAGDCFVVSAAAGAVGNIAGQIARLHGCRVIGITGGRAKADWLVDELGFDAAIDHHAETVEAGLERLAPEGVNIFFDNVGGEMLDAVLARLARGARVALCGATSQYADTGPMRGPSNYFTGLVYNAATMRGFHIFDYRDRFEEARGRLSRWLADGRIKACEDVVTGGAAAFPAALERLFTGRNCGKLLVRMPGADM